MKGRQQGRCSGCGRGKGTHDRNAGWYELGPRKANGYRLEHLFCPSCSASLLVGLDERMGEARKNPNMVAVLSGDLVRALRILESAPRPGWGGVTWQNERAALVDHFAQLIGRKPWTTEVPT